MTKEDKAGPTIGWSLATGMDKKNIEELIELPTVYSFKVIGEASEEYQAAIMAEVEKIRGRTLEEQEYAVRTSAEGKYLSITLKLHVTSLEEIYELYAVLKSNPRTKMVL